MNDETNRFDVAILGGGPGGYVAAIRASQLGKRVALVEKEKIGGTCLHRGCIPTKALLHQAEILRTVRESGKHGIRVSDIRVDWEAVMESQRAVVERLHKGLGFLMKKNKVTFFQGHGSLLSSNEIEIRGSDAISHIQAEKIILATGSVARSLPGIEFDEESILSNIGALNLPKVPQSLVVIGAGAVGVEFASIYRSFGSEVTLLEYMPRVVPLEDEEVSRQLLRSFKKARIDVHTGVRVTDVTKTNSGVRVTYDEKGREVTLDAEVCLIAVGRRAVTEGIGLENTKVKTEKGVVCVDENCLTQDSSIYAIGDLIGNYQLAHVAEVEGWLAASHLAGKPVEAIDYRAVPRCTFCRPQIGSVGFSQKEAESRGIPVKVAKFPFQANGKALSMGETEGFSKIVAHAESGEILGAHIIGPDATELLMEMVVGMKNKISVSHLAHTIHPHPTLSEVNLEVFHAVLGEPVHG